MHLHFLARLSLVFAFFNNVAFSATIVNGDTSSNITAHITQADNLTVTDDKGGWFDRGLELQQLGGWDTPFAVGARLRILSSSGTFQVRLDEPLRIQNTNDPSQVFIDPEIKFGNEGDLSVPLLVGKNSSFQNPVAEPGDDSIGYYDLSITAMPPEGDFKTTTGTYSGVLSLIFEPVVRIP
ncbi:hypothetical protein QMK50_23925 [Pseudomonas sp. P5_152]|uniref:hypothetical protein n=1 Tax=Pseudomonas sp. P5_152 TaxID=3043442 RepID=UPI002A3623E9|nr:hypothetical protein [Pseudomonas sp. P5_152]MDX9668002.1 hypothetical protein [Pseudomonas sp. P5_152]